MAQEFSKNLDNHSLSANSSSTIEDPKMPSTDIEDERQKYGSFIKNETTFEDNFLIAGVVAEAVPATVQELLKRNGLSGAERVGSLAFEKSATGFAETVGSSAFRTIAGGVGAWAVSELIFTQPTTDLDTVSGVQLATLDSLRDNKAAQTDLNKALLEKINNTLKAYPDQEFQIIQYKQDQKNILALATSDSVIPIMEDLTIIKEDQKLLSQGQSQTIPEEVEELYRSLDREKIQEWNLPETPSREQLVEAYQRNGESLDGIGQTLNSLMRGGGGIAPPKTPIETKSISAGEDPEGTNSSTQTRISTLTDREAFAEKYYERQLSKTQEKLSSAELEKTGITQLINKATQEIQAHQTKIDELAQASADVKKYQEHLALAPKGKPTPEWLELKKQLSQLPEVQDFQISTNEIKSIEKNVIKFDKKLEVFDQKIDTLQGSLVELQTPASRQTVVNQIMESLEKSWTEFSQYQDLADLQQASEVEPPFGGFSKQAILEKFPNPASSVEDALGVRTIVNESSGEQHASGMANRISYRYPVEDKALQQSITERIGEIDPSAKGTISVETYFHNYHEGYPANWRVNINVGKQEFVVLAPSNGGELFIKNAQTGTLELNPQAGLISGGAKGDYQRAERAGRNSEESFSVYGENGVQPLQPKEIFNKSHWYPGITY
jgi:hypothetical protein